MDNHNDELKKDIGKRLAKARRACKVNGDEMSQGYAADKLGIPKYQTLSAYETGKNSPPLATLKKMAVLYGVTTDWIIFGDDLPTPHKSIEEYVKQLVDAVDNLNLNVSMNTSEGYPQSKTYTIELTSFMDEGVREFDTFIEKWIRLRETKKNNGITEEEYLSLISRRLEEYEKEPKETFFL